MKKLLLLLSIFPVLSWGQVKISNLPVASTVSDADLLPLVQSGTTKQLSYGIINNNIKTLVSDSIQALKTVWTNSTASKINRADTVKWDAKADSFNTFSALAGKLATSVWTASTASKINGVDTVKWNANVTYFTYNTSKDNTGIGTGALINGTGYNNIGIGSYALNSLTKGNYRHGKL